jgi:hypothetical protein
VKVARFTLGSALDCNGRTVPAYGFTHEGHFIVNAFASPCGRFNADPVQYGLTTLEAHKLAELNRERNLLAYT